MEKKYSNLENIGIIQGRMEHTLPIVYINDLVAVSHEGINPQKIAFTDNKMTTALEGRVEVGDVIGIDLGIFGNHSPEQILVKVKAGKHEFPTPLYTVSVVKYAPSTLGLLEHNRLFYLKDRVEISDATNDHYLHTAMITGIEKKEKLISYHLEDEHYKEKFSAINNSIARKVEEDLEKILEDEYAFTEFFDQALEENPLYQKIERSLVEKELKLRYKKINELQLRMGYEDQIGNRQRLENYTALMDFEAPETAFWRIEQYPPNRIYKLSSVR